MVVGLTLSPLLGVSYKYGGKGSATRYYFLQLLYPSIIFPILDVLHALSFYNKTTSHEQIDEVVAGSTNFQWMKVEFPKSESVNNIVKSQVNILLVHGISLYPLPNKLQIGQIS